LKDLGAVEECLNSKKLKIAKFWVETMFLELHSSFVARYETAKEDD